MTDQTQPKTLLAMLDAHYHCISLYREDGHVHAYCEGDNVTGSGDDVVEALLDMAFGLFGRAMALPEEVELISKLHVSGESLHFYQAPEEDPQRWDVGRDSFGSGDTLIEAIREHLAMAEEQA